MSDYHDHPFWTERFDSEAELRESNALVFDANDFIELGGDDEAREIMELAMDRDMAERDRCWADEARRLRDENEHLHAVIEEMENR